MRIYCIYVTIATTVALAYLAGRKFSAPPLPLAPQPECNLTRVGESISWLDATPEQYSAATLALRAANWQPVHRVVVFWHVYTDGNRSQEIISRQYELLLSSGLLDVADEVLIGHVGLAPLTLPAAAMKKIRIVARASAGFECVTTSALWQFAKNASTRVLVLYMHTRGVTHSQRDGPAEDWTHMLEYRTVRMWHTTAALLDNATTRVVTAGCEKWRAAGYGDYGLHYSGNFWWATTDYIAQLTDPLVHATYGIAYYMCSEQWILSLKGRERDFADDPVQHFTLFATGPREGACGSIQSYMDAFPPTMYTCRTPQGLPTRSPCHPINLSLCHGCCCALNSYK